MSAAPQKFRTEFDGETLLVVTLGNLGEFQFHEIETEAEPILRRLNGEDVQSVVIDLAATDYCGSAALAFFLKIWKRMRDRQGAMLLCNASPAIQEILEMTKMDSIWPVYDSRAAAIAAHHQSERPE